jgi:hypothetical protein
VPEAGVGHALLLRPKLRPTVVADSRIIRAKGPDQLELLGVHLLVGGRLRLPEDLLAHGPVAALLWRKVTLNETAVGTAEVGDAAGDVLADVNLPVRVRDLVDDLHTQLLDVFLLEVVEINFLQLDCPNGTDANVVANEQTGQFLSIDEN